jgi:hypothetical protein
MEEEKTHTRDMVFEFPEKGGHQIKVTDKTSGLTIVFNGEEPVDLENTNFEALTRGLAEKMLEIIDQLESFDGDALINPTPQEE